MTCCISACCVTKVQSSARSARLGSEYRVPGVGEPSKALETTLANTQLQYLAALRQCTTKMSQRARGVVLAGRRSGVSGRLQHLLVLGDARPYLGMLINVLLCRRHGRGTYLDETGLAETRWSQRLEQLPRAWGLDGKSGEKRLARKIAVRFIREPSSSSFPKTENSNIVCRRVEGVV